MNEQAVVVFMAGGRSYTAVDVRAALRVAGVHEGSDVFVHADLQSLGKIGEVRSREAFAQIFIDVLSDAVGEAGTLIMPTFTYSFCRDEVYDPQRSPSRVGLLGEQFRQLPGVVRSRDPIFSVAAHGARQAYYTAVGEDCFGEQSVFAKLYQRDATFIFIGETFDMTYLHYVEQRVGVSYRYRQRFSGFVRGETLIPAIAIYFVRPQDGSVRYDLNALRYYLERRGVVQSVPLGASFVRGARAQPVYANLAEELRRDERFLLNVGVYAPAG
ncbi:MAG: AAC(3) family N-acetyltransferase [Candidatus Andersenbacteria bacterium]|nr:AAC(3) family N-acetyltransferase [Candidatus Andersenbacteria bacterium]